MNLIKKIFLTVSLLALVTATAITLVACGKDCDHSFGEWETKTAATCEEAGVQERVCKKCDKVESEAIKALGHKYGDTKNDNNASCVSPGTKSAPCTNEGCTSVKVERLPGNPIGHTYKNGVCTACNDTMTLEKTFNDASGITVKVYLGKDGHYELDVIGSGSMKDYTAEEATPWTEYASKVSSIHIYEGITAVGDYAFEDFTKVKNVFIDKGVKNVGLNAFNPSTAPERVYIDDITTWIGMEYEGAGAPVLCLAKFLYMTGEVVDVVKNVDIPEGVTEIAPYAFYNNSMILTVKIPESLTKIGEYAFYGAKAIEEVHVKSLEAWCKVDFAGEYANPLNVGQDLYVNDVYTTVLEIPDGITSIGARAFEGCASIKEIVLGKDVAAIGAKAFYKCKNVDKITLNDGLVTISEYAFYGCAKLTELVIPSSVESVAADAFRDCASLKTVTIASGTQIAADAFANCTSLLTVNYGGTEDEWTALGVVLGEGVTVNFGK